MCISFYASDVILVCGLTRFQRPRSNQSQRPMNICSSNALYHLTLLILLCFWGSSLGCSRSSSECQDTEGCQVHQVCQAGVCVQRSTVEDSPEPAKEERPRENVQKEAITQEPAPEDAGGMGDQDETPELATSDAPSCTKNERRPCYSGAKGTEGVGECQAGVQFCQDDGSWTACRNQIVPTAEVCDGKDNDCNGKVDDGMPPTPCTQQDGACKGAVQRCAGAKGWRICEDADYARQSPDYEVEETRCDGKDNDCDGRIDNLGPSQTCTMPSGKSDCQQGHKVCQSNAPQCQTINQPLPFEICGNQKDDNCDGSVDEATACPLVALNGKPSDYTVLPNGNIALAYGMKIQCLTPKGNTFQPVSSLELDPGQNKQELSLTHFHGVWTLPNAGRVLAIWTYVVKTPQYPWKFRSYFRLLDGVCKPLTTRTLLTESSFGGTSQKPVTSVAVMPNDTFAIAIYDDAKGGRLLRFDANGKKAPSELQLLPANRSLCKASSRSTDLFVALNAKGQGVAVCSVQATPNGTLYWRRLDANTLRFTDNQYQVLQPSQGKTQTANSPAINPQGHLRLSFRASGVAQVHHVFLDPQGTTRSHFIRTTLGNAWLKPNVWGDDFFEGSEDTGEWRRFNNKGAVLAETKAKVFQVRLGAKGQLYALASTPNGTTLQANAFSLQALTCQGQRCVCHPYEQRECITDPWYATLKGSCRAGKQLCRPDGLGWGPCRNEGTRDAEQCNDGVDNDCDGQVDEECTTLNTFRPPGVDTFDVADDGSVAAAFWNGANLIGYCYRKDRSVRRGYALVSTPQTMAPDALTGYTQTSLSVRIARKSGHVLFTWRQEEGPKRTLMSRLYDKDCMPLTPPFAWSTEPVLLLSSGQELHRVEMDDNGNFVLHGQAPSTQQHLVERFDNAGTKLGVPLELNPKGSPCTGSFRVALHPSTLEGLALCQDTQGEILYRRFHLRKGWLDAKPIQLLSLAQQNNKVQSPTLLRINSKGEMVLLTSYAFQELKVREHTAYFLDSNRLLVKRVTVGSTALNDQPHLTNEAKLQLWKDDFVFRNGGSQSQKVTWYRYSPQGQLVQQATYTANKIFPLDSLRIGNQQTYLKLEGAIQRDLVLFAP
ncbi:MAG: hypothetical protein EP343_29745 [Deltaproteobacteria bacterium]|nr:MAG: hypothetical protein EP343_29745 [Deltaproteobacteria bacterium]